MGWFTSDDKKLAEAKTSAHQRRAANGQRITKSVKNYTTGQKIADQQRDLNPKQAKPAKPRNGRGGEWR